MTKLQNNIIMNLADTIEGEVNRMCITNDLDELNTMAQHAVTNIVKLEGLIYRAKFEKRGKE